MTKRILGMVFGIIVLSGCYTQFAVVRREPPPPQVTYEVDSLGDTVKVVHTTDTVVSERENCYWTRNTWGEPEWRCGSYYSHSWYLYNDYPWWYSSYPYYYDFNGRCPQYYYYDASCGSCRRFDGGGHFYSSGRGGGKIISPSGGSVEHRSRSSTVPDKSTVKNYSGQNSPAPQKTGTSKIEASGIRDQAPVVENPSPPPASSMPPPRETIQSNPPASNPSPSPNSSGGGDNSGSGSDNRDQNHRNPRSWK
jgi:hypothetical protein